MAWISNGGENVVAPKRYMKLSTISTTNIASVAVGNDVFGQVKLTISGTTTAGIIASVVPPIPLPAAAYVYLTPADSLTGPGGLATGSTVGWYASVSTAGNVAIGISGAISSVLSSATINYFVAQ